jgi:hypothetical protein
VVAEQHYRQPQAAATFRSSMFKWGADVDAKPSANGVSVWGGYSSSTLHHLQPHGH